MGFATSRLHSGRKLNVLCHRPLRGPNAGAQVDSLGIDVDEPSQESFLVLIIGAPLRTVRLANWEIGTCVPSGVGIMTRRSFDKSSRRPRAYRTLTGYRSRLSTVVVTSSPPTAASRIWFTWATLSL